MSFESPPMRHVPLVKSKTSGMAIASVVLGGLAFCTAGLAGTVGLVLGIIALAKINNRSGDYSGRGVAIAGISLSAIGMVFGCVSALLVGLLLPALAKARFNAQSIVAQAHMAQLG